MERSEKMLDSILLEASLNSESDTNKLSCDFLDLLQDSRGDTTISKLFKKKLPQIVAVNGDLGSGKTTWVRYLLKNMGVEGRIKSPTYSLMEMYPLYPKIELQRKILENIKNIYHWDWYRINDPSEIEMLGFDEMLDDDSLHIIEWAEKFVDLLPSNRIEMQFALEHAVSSDMASDDLENLHFRRSCSIRLIN